jgi:hypothetical protein
MKEIEKYTAITDETSVKPGDYMSNSRDKFTAIKDIIDPYRDIPVFILVRVSGILLGTENNIIHWLRPDDPRANKWAAEVWDTDDYYEVIAWPQWITVEEYDSREEAEAEAVKLRAGIRRYVTKRPMTLEKAQKLCAKAGSDTEWHSLIRGGEEVAECLAVESRYGAIMSIVEGEGTDAGKLILSVVTSHDISEIVSALHLATT